jgi:heme/copper-type cytochrome/quinol oxidase subunit 2
MGPPLIWFFTCNPAATNTTFSKRADPIIIDVLNTTMPNTTTLVGYMPDYLRKYNVSLRVFNGDSPLCTPVEFHHSVVSLPQDWKIQCYPNMTLLLRGQQACNLDCVVETPVIASTTSFDVIHSFAVQLDGTSTYPSGVL